MQHGSIFVDVFRYDDWANGKMMALAAGLDDAQLDVPKAMGFGSLRATLFHILAATELWQDRFDGMPWAPLDVEPRRIAHDEIVLRLQQVSQRRQQLLASEQATGFERVVEYTNTERQTFRHRLADLLTHVANHSIHHRAQALNLLRGCGRSVPGGLDYLYFKLANPSIPQTSETIAMARSMQIEVGHATLAAEPFDIEWMRRFANYGVWAMDQLFQIAAGLPQDGWSQKFAIGSGSVRSTLCHICDAERWWLQNLVAGPHDYQVLPEDLSCTAARAEWDRLVTERESWLRRQTDASLDDVVAGKVGGGELRFRVGEVLLQLCGHGTHHRAQAVNMLRQLGRPAPPLDFVVWLRRGTPLAPPLNRDGDPRY